MPLARVIALAAAAIVFAAPGAGAAPAGGPTVLAFPSAQSIPPSGRLPQGGDPIVTLNAAIGEREGAWLVVTGAQSVSAKIDGGGLGKLKADLSFAHYVSFAGGVVPDALLPWNGSSHPVEKPNQPLYLQVCVPAGPAGYRAMVTVVPRGSIDSGDDPRLRSQAAAAVGDAGESPDGLSRRPRVVCHQGRPVVPSRLESGTLGGQRQVVLVPRRLPDLAQRLGIRRAPIAQRLRQIVEVVARLGREHDRSEPFVVRRSDRSRTSGRACKRIAHPPFDLYAWCDYLQSVRGFWAEHGWLDGHLAYLYALDEPGLEGMRIVGQQSATAHRCWPGSRTLVTGNPTPANRFVWDGKGGDDVDIWAVLSRRYYGQFNHPLDKFESISAARQAGAMVWSTTYTGVAGTPGYSADEPLADPRMFLLWNALEGIRGTLYAQGTTSYGKGNPLDSAPGNGESVLIYPGADGPVPSARLEQIRDGIEDWDLLDAVRRKRGPDAVRTILGEAGLFSTTSQGVKLACTMGCELSGSTKFSWPQWSHDAATAAKIEAAHLQALKLASG
jgi:hypothetical protein